MAYEKDLTIVRQNQSGHVRELLKSKGWIGYISTYEFMGYVELWTDYIINGPTDSNKKRFKDFDNLISERISLTQAEVDGVIL